MNIFAPNLRMCLHSLTTNYMQMFTSHQVSDRIEWNIVLIRNYFKGMS